MREGPWTVHTLDEAWASQLRTAAVKVGYTHRPLAYTVRAMLAGSYIGIAVVLMVSAAGPLAAAGSPWTMLVQGLVFGVALTLVVTAGGELATSNMMTLAQGVAFLIATPRSTTFRSTGAPPRDRLERLRDLVHARRTASGASLWRRATKGGVMSSTPQDPKDEAPVTGTTPEDAPQTAPDPTPPTQPAPTTPATTPPPPPWVTGTSTPTPPPATAPSPPPPAAPVSPTPPTATGAPGQHAAPRPYPPSAPSERTPTRPNGFEGAVARERPTAYAPTGLPPTTPPTAPPGSVPSTGAAAPAPLSAFPAGGTPADAAPLGAAPQATGPQATGPQSPVPATTGVTPPPPAGSVAAPADRPRRELPEPPAKPGIGRHFLAGVLGLVLTPFAMLLIGVGTSRLADIAGTNDMGTDMLGTSLLALGLALVAAIVLLGAWSAVLPIVGGLVWGVALGLAYLMFPVTMEDSAEAMTSSGSVPVAIEQLADAAMTGYLLVLGTLMIAAGIATALARRRGRRWAERVAVTERAQADAAREDAELAGRP